MSQSRPSFLIFDWDNTLIDSWACLHEAINITLDAMGHAPWSMDEVRTRIALSLRDHFPVLFGDRWEEARAVFYAAFKQVHLLRLKPLDGVDEMLSELNGRGFLMGVVSNKTGAYLREESDHLGWNGYFHRLVGATDAARDKPAPDPVRMVLEGSGIEAGRNVWFIGDAPVDMECAANTGCTPILLRPHPPKSGEFHSHPFRVHFKTPGDLLLYLESGR
ncbi:HAD-superfamily hydrolase [Rhodospirillaceae bacterium LM-1]|nr:HAD-superfamily hydrolase [Rhodospirillaceae bacterium LM-1]